MPTDYAELHRPAGRFAAGWIVARRDWAGAGDGDGIALAHQGSNTMWHAGAWLAPQRDWVMLATTNAADPGGSHACDQAIGVVIEAMDDAREAGSGDLSGPEQREDQAGQ